MNNNGPFKFDKDLDLHDSEWNDGQKKEPVFGAGFLWFSRVLVPTIIVGVVFAVVWSRVIDYVWDAW